MAQKLYIVHRYIHTHYKNSYSQRDITVCEGVHAGCSNVMCVCGAEPVVRKPNDLYAKRHKQN